MDEMNGTGTKADVIRKLRESIAELAATPEDHPVLLTDPAYVPSDPTRGLFAWHSGKRYIPIGPVCGGMMTERSIVAGIQCGEYAIVYAGSLVSATGRRFSDMTDEEMDKLAAGIAAGFRGD